MTSMLLLFSVSQSSQWFQSSQGSQYPQVGYLADHQNLGADSGKNGRNKSKNASETLGGQCPVFPISFDFFESRKCPGAPVSSRVALRAPNSPNDPDAPSAEAISYPSSPLDLPSLRRGFPKTRDF
jgi:hypothetical protein